VKNTLLFLLRVTDRGAFKDSDILKFWVHIQSCFPVTKTNPIKEINDGDGTKQLRHQNDARDCTKQFHP
jgi:hypothetical protein